MSVFSFVLVAFGCSSLISTFIVIIAAMQSAQTARLEEKQEKLLRNVTRPISKRADSQTLPLGVLDLDMDAKLT